MSTNNKNDRGFYVLGDEWGLTKIVPAENCEQFERVRQEFAEHHKGTEFSLEGWPTPPFVIPSPEIPLLQRKIPLSELEGVFAGILESADFVETDDINGVDFRDADFYAFAWANPANEYYSAGFYGAAPHGILKSLHIDGYFAIELARRLAEPLARFGAKYSLVLISHADTIIDLQNVEDMTDFLCGFDRYWEEYEN